MLRLSPPWSKNAYWALALAFAVSALYAVFGTLHEYASGPAVVWIADRLQITATVGGTVSAIDVRPGDRVEAGQVLVRFSSAVELAELERVEREFELQLAKTLRDASDQAARAALTALHTERDVAAAKLERLSVRAPRAGLIGDIRIRAGQLIGPGDIVVTLLDEDRRCSVMAVLPAQYRPQLRPGMSMRFEVTGYRYAYQEMVIRTVGTQIIGPNEVKRYLGQEIGDTVTVSGPVVIVEATPASSTFTVDGDAFDFYHGMSGVAEVRVRTESILVALIPGLRAVIGRPHV